MIWVAPACILAAVFLLSLVRVKVQGEYDDRSLTVRLGVGPMSFRLLPAKKEGGDRPPKKRVKRRKAKKAAEPAKKDIKKDIKNIMSLALELLPVALRAAGSLRRKISVDLLEVRVLLAGDDPASTALSFGRVNALVGMVLPLLEQNFHIRRRDIRTSVDFQRPRSEVCAKAALSLTVGQGAMFALRFGWQAVRVLLRWQRRDKEAHAAEHMSERKVIYGKEPSHQ